MTFMSSLKTEEKLILMNDVTGVIISYLEEQKEINEEALKAYDLPIQDGDSEIRQMREREAIKIRDRISELKRHISVIKKMFPKSPTKVIEEVKKNVRKKNNE